MVLPLSRRFPWIFLLILSAILLSYSRIAIFAISALMIFWLIKNFRSKLLVWSASLALIGAIIFLSFKLSSGILYEEIISPQSKQWLINNAPEKRVIIWPIIFEFISQRPILGYGLDNLDKLFSGYQKFHGDRDPAYYGINNLNIDHSHNYMLDLLTFSGSLGLLAWLGLIFMLFKKAKGTGLLIPFLIYLFWIQFQVQGIVHLLYFWLLVGLLDRKPKLGY